VGSVEKGLRRGEFRDLEEFDLAYVEVFVRILLVHPIIRPAAEEDRLRGHRLVHPGLLAVPRTLSRALLELTY